MDELKARLEFLITFLMEKFGLIEVDKIAQEDRLLTVAEAEEYLKITERSLRRYRKQGRINTYPIGGFVYYRLSELVNLKRNGNN